jgi:hypothetical protein
MSSDFLDYGVLKTIDRVKPFKTGYACEKCNFLISNKEVLRITNHVLSFDATKIKGGGAQAQGDLICLLTEIGCVNTQTAKQTDRHTDSSVVS